MSDLPSVEATREALEREVLASGLNNLRLPKEEFLIVGAVARAYAEGRLVEAPTVDIEAARVTVADAIHITSGYARMGLTGSQALRLADVALSAAGVIEDTVPGDGSEK